MRSIAALLFLLGVLALSCVKPPPPEAAGQSAPLAKGPAEKAPEFASETDARVPIDRDDATRGKRDALVTLVVASDFQCPFCSRVVPTLDALREIYGDDLRIVWKHHPLPFHDHAKLAAEIGEGVRATRGDEAFWRYHDLVFAEQSKLGPDTLRAWAVAAGADAHAIDAGVESHAWTAKVERDDALAERLGARGTPVAWINGTKIEGAHPLDKFKEVVSSELAKAKALVARGTARDAVYRVLTAENFDNAPKGDDKNDDDDDDKPDTTRWKVVVGTSPARGPKDAPVTLVEFSDFQCPFCKRIEPTLDQLRQTYGDKLRVVWKDSPLPFHPRAKPAAELARAARAQKGDAGFWSVHQKLFAAPGLEDSDLQAIAKSAGLDATQAMAAVKAATYAKGIEADLAAGDDVSASGTPHFFINGRRLVGAKPIDAFKKMIDEELETFAGQKGKVAAKDYYAHLMTTAKSAPPADTKTASAPGQPAPFLGAPNGKVVIQEWSDFQCPFCGRVEATLEELVKAYPNDVKILWRDMPLPMHPDAPLAAEAAREAFVQKGNAGFAKMRKLLFAHTHPEVLKRPALEAYATEAGLDLAKFNAALDARVHRRVVEAEAEAGHKAGISGTPAFLVGPYYLSGAQPLPKFKKLVELVRRPPSP